MTLFFSISTAILFIFWDISECFFLRENVSLRLWGKTCVCVCVSVLEHWPHLSSTVFFFISDPNTGCPLGYVRNNELKSCYLFVTRYMKWYQAETFCMTQGAHLVAIESSQEQTFIMQHIKSNSQGNLSFYSYMHITGLYDCHTVESTCDSGFKK